MTGAEYLRTIDTFAQLGEIFARVGITSYPTSARIAGGEPHAGDELAAIFTAARMLPA